MNNSTDISEFDFTYVDEIVKCVECKQEKPESKCTTVDSENFKEDFFEEGNVKEETYICIECYDKQNCVHCSKTPEEIYPMVAGICEQCSLEGWKCYYDYCYGETVAYKQ